ncbi:MAG: hypothetical protein ACREUD_00025 [Gammaproteobacteria bacterium]
MKLHPLLRDHDLPVWYHGRDDMTLDDLVARVVSTDELRIHVGEVSHEDEDDMSSDRFASGFTLSDDVAIMPNFGVGWNREAHFPWFLGVAPIDYQSRLEAALTGVWGGFEKHKKHDAVVGEVDGKDGIEIHRSVTVYRRISTV